MEAPQCGKIYGLKIVKNENHLRYQWKELTCIIKGDIYVGDSYSIQEKKKTAIGERSKNDRWYTLSKFFVLFFGAG